MPFDVEKYVEENDNSFLDHFGYPDAGDDEGYSGEEGEGE